MQRKRRLWLRLRLWLIQLLLFRLRARFLPLRKVMLLHLRLKFQLQRLRLRQSPRRLRIRDLFFEIKKPALCGLFLWLRAGSGFLFPAFVALLPIGKGVAVILVGFPAGAGGAQALFIAAIEDLADQLV